MQAHDLGCLASHCCGRHVSSRVFYFNVSIHDLHSRVIDLHNTYDPCFIQYSHGWNGTLFAGPNSLAGLSYTDSLSVLSESQSRAEQHTTFPNYIAVILTDIHRPPGVGAGLAWQMK